MAESTALLKRHTRKGIAGSNPALTAVSPLRSSKQAESRLIASESTSRTVAHRNARKRSLFDEYSTSAGQTLCGQSPEVRSNKRALSRRLYRKRRVSDDSGCNRRTPESPLLSRAQLLEISIFASPALSGSSRVLMESLRTNHFATIRANDQRARKGMPRSHGGIGTPACVWRDCRSRISARIVCKKSRMPGLRLRSCFANFAFAPAGA